MTRSNPSPLSLGALFLGLLLCSVPVGAEEDLAPVPKGKRRLVVGLNMADEGGFDSAFAQGQRAGMNAASLPINWDDIEVKPGVFEPKVNFLAIANLYYPPKRMPIALGLRPIDTNGSHLPKDLRSLPLDHPRVLKRFGAFLRWVFKQIPQVELDHVAVGNEIDLGLRSDKAWKAYVTFFRAARTLIHELRPKVVVGVKATHGGLTGGRRAQLAAVNAHADAVLATYYPLAKHKVKSPKEVRADLEALLALAGKKPLYLAEVGCPTSPILGSSEARQAEFVHNVFAFWDRHPKRVPFAAFIWLHESTPAGLDAYERYYKFSHPGFRAFLGTLALRHREGKGRDKKGFVTLCAEAKARGW
jgi:hypothetical protein